MRVTLSLAALAALTVGCNKSEPGGPAPGTDNSFTFTLPTVTTTVKQGTSEMVKVTLNRGKDFKQKVSFKATVSPDKGVKVGFEPKDSVLASDPAETNVKVTVDKDAPVGDYKVAVTGTPDTGSATTKDFSLKVATP